MPNYFYTDASGQRRGPVTDQQLQTLATQGVITPNTPMETDGGHKGTAGQIPGLKFNNPVMPPSGVKVGQFVQKVVDSLDSGSGWTPLLSRHTFIILAVSVGLFGVHSFYAKRNAQGMAHLACLAPWILVFSFSIITSLLGTLGIRVEVDWFNSLSPSVESFARAGSFAYFAFIVLPLASYVMAMVEIVFITKDGLGRELERM